MSKSDYLTLNSADAWDVFIGSQSPKKFMELSPEMTIREAVANYRQNGDTFQDLTQEEADHIESMLEDYICDVLEVKPNEKFKES